MTMKKAITMEDRNCRFVGVYGLRDPQRHLTQELTQARPSIEAVMADLADKQEREGKLCFVQIVDLSLLEPVEPYQTTLARLRRAALI
jgi:hypothetical protein